MVEHEINGLHIQPGNTVELADAINRLMDDDVLHGRLARAARKKFEAQYAPDVGLEALLECYERAMVNRRRAA
jgi:glycosyltransferase involved in cell wall biosynthesis